jgi:hypothetical protein
MGYMEPIVQTFHLGVTLATDTYLINYFHEVAHDLGKRTQADKLNEDVQYVFVSVYREVISVPHSGEGSDDEVHRKYYFVFHSLYITQVCLALGPYLPPCH